MMETQGASVVITHHVLDGKQIEYEKWLDEILPVSKSAKGFIDWQIVRPIPNLTFVYTVIIRFDTIENLRNWMESDTRRKLIDKAHPLFTKEDNYEIKSGLDFLFYGEKENKVPVRWKQYLATWSAIYPLSLLMQLLLLPSLRLMNIPANRYFDTLVSTGCLVFLVIYVVMPNYTKLIRKWLYK
ncbi:antibiotic biosynthesis monooxygenase [Chryseobacterium sp. FH1]|uniref:antibiotic biosynthesis monooxygenase n=1 Tax=Chryseobacterium sp. FH1 TaxID=1233951 RepID=UPI0004E37BA3|nr:antibiotic biosynthesis monooxygenase [Chryseobacterium sp. FH1]KFC19444.1 antibiotic biosynthesis monooxygenase [Chryseobacterium sp. FH1]